MILISYSNITFIPPPPIYFVLISSGGDPQNDYPDGKYVKCIVIGPSKSKGTVELSLRDSRVEKGNLDNDPTPTPNDMVHAYVANTTKMGCFVRLSRSVEGRVILKELSDDFIPNPQAVYPPGRLVVGKVKHVKESSNNNKKGGRHAITMVDIDMRESVLLTSADRLSIDDIELNSKHTGVITRVESYGVFVRIDNSDVSGLAHVSECSDSYIKNVFDLYNPGDFVKLVVIEMDNEKRRLAFSLKASNFDDSDDDDSSSSSSSSSGDELSDKDSDGEAEDLDSDDENFAAKLAKKMEEGKEGSAGGDDDDSSSSEGTSSSDSESSDNDSDEDEVEEKPKDKVKAKSMDTDVGFNWGSSAKPAKSSKLAAAESSDDESDSSSSSEESDDDDADTGFKSSHNSRKKAAAKRREEEETSRREIALADGTADETPETSADFERLVASSPNSSEVWIKYMAFHLSLADIDSARNVANRAFERIEFRQEGEKVRLNRVHFNYLAYNCIVHSRQFDNPSSINSSAQCLDSLTYTRTQVWN